MLNYLISLVRKNRKIDVGALQAWWLDREAALLRRRADREEMAIRARKGAATKIHNAFERDALLREVRG